MAKAIAPAKKTAVKKSAKKAAPKKAAAKTAVTKPAAAKPKKEPTIKYDDKSAGQPELIPVFEAITKMILKYEGKRKLELLKKDTYGQTILISRKPVVIEGKPRTELWFVAALIQKGYVGFYHKPPYKNDEMKKQFSEKFVKSLKGKGCFHIKDSDPVVMKDIEKVMKIGFEDYVAKGLL